MIAPSDNSVAMMRYENTQGLPQELEGPLQAHLHARRAWERCYVDLKEGKLVVRENRDSTPSVTMLLQGMAMALNSEEPHSFKLISCFSSGITNEYLVVRAGSHNEMLEWTSALYYGIAILNGGGYILALEMLAQQWNVSRKEVVAETIARLTQRELLKQTELTAEELKQLEEELIEGVLQDESRQGIEADDFDDTDARILASVSSLMDDMLAVVINRSVMEEAIEEPSHTSYTDAAISLSNNEPEVVPTASSETAPAFPYEAAPTVAYDAASTTASHIDNHEAALPRRSVGLPSSTQFAPVVVFRQPRITVEDMVGVDGDESYPLVSREEIRQVFLENAKIGADGKQYINVMQFSGLWRRASGQKGNLFKEMQMFNNRYSIVYKFGILIFGSFDLEGRGFVQEEEFVAGWEKIQGSAGGGRILNNLVTLTPKITPRMK